MVRGEKEGDGVRGGGGEGWCEGRRRDGERGKRRGGMV